MTLSLPIALLTPRTEVPRTWEGGGERGQKASYGKELDGEVAVPPPSPHRDALPGGRAGSAPAVAGLGSSLVLPGSWAGRGAPVG